MKRRIITILALLTIVLLAVMALDLKGVAVAKISPSASQNSTTQKAADGVFMMSNAYNLRLIPAAASENSTALSSVIQGGNYILSQPISPNDATGCCCKKYLSCVDK